MTDIASTAQQSRRFLAALIAIALMSGLAVDPASAQSIRLSPEQQMMLNQLPPAQRQQALAALEQINRQQGGAPSQSSINETLTQAIPPADALTGAFDQEQEPRAAERSRLVISLEPEEELGRAARQLMGEDAALQQVLGSHFYELDDEGILVLPGLASIPLLGLDAEQIEQRLGAEPALQNLTVSAMILEIATTGAEALEPFGYDVFEPDATGLDPVITGPVPPDYVLGPGDSIRVQLFGNVNGIYEFEVTRDGILNLPEIGPVTVAGLPFSEFRADLNRRVSEMLIGTQVSVTMGQLRTIRVFVLGDVNQPGSYVVSSLATISSALYRSGGISRIGTLRDIQLKRSGDVVSRLDLYDLLLNGDTSNDSRLQPGDVIFVPPIGPQVSVSGAVKRPAIYEVRGNASIADVIRLAGGLEAEAYPDGARIERVDSGRQRIVVSIDADAPDAASTHLRAGDVLVIPRVLPELEDTVTLAGHVHRPGPYQWRDGMRLTDLVGSLLELKPGADSDYVLVRREDPVTRRVSVTSANLTAALGDRRSQDNLVLWPRDTVHVFSLAFGRQRVIQPILDELEQQSRLGEPFAEVSVSGQVKAPGTYPLEPGMRIHDLIRAGGNLAEQAYELHAELARYEIVDNEYRNTEVIPIRLDAVLRGDGVADLELREHDNLRISTVPEWDTLWTVQLEGEVRFPGQYRVRRGETLRQVLERAGGLTEAAFPEGAIFLRESLRDREQEQIEILARRMEADITSLSLETLDTTGSEALATGRQLLTQLRSTEAVGRLVIDLDTVNNRGGDGARAGDIELRDGDRLLVP
ncbi:MAG: SLBB domain-containing protein, partial [Gammaproteobacteria bacterium]|nr:SLBB domain-containing protein [Gammaproteobacteria bacterium]